MRAFVLTDETAQPAIVELPDPAPGPGEILVSVAGSSVNGFDLAAASGLLREMMEHRYPLVLGKDFSGTVQAAGDGVNRFGMGDRVFGVVTKAYLGDGGLGELLVVAADGVGVTAAPDSLDLAIGGALGLAGTAAIDSVDAVAPQPGETVLICGATGGVGSLAVQYATATGATVLATARPGKEADLVTALGATHVLDYKWNVAEQVRAIAPRGVDAIIHMAGDAATLTDLLASGGRLASTLGFGPGQHPAAIAVSATPVPATLDRLAADVASGHLQVPVQKTYQLEDAAEAFAAFGQGTLGKLAVAVSNAPPR